MRTQPDIAPPPLLDLDEPPPYGVLNPDGASDVLLLCEHALPRIPRRLVVDCNRPLDNPSLMPEISETTAIPGNSGLAAADRAERLDALFHPFQSAVSRRLDLRSAAGKPTFVVGVHSYTPVYKGLPRLWHAGILYAGATEFAGRLIGALAQESGLVIGDNEPYRIDHDDYTVPVHGDARGLPALLIEVRHDLISTAQGVAEWAERLERCLRLSMGAQT